MKLNTRKERINFDVRSDLQAMHEVAAHNQDSPNNSPKARTALTRTYGFIICKNCRHRNTKHANLCEECDEELSTRPILTRLL